MVAATEVDDPRIAVKVKQAAEMLDTSVWTVYRMLEDGQLRGFRLRGKRGIRISRKELDDFIASQS